MTKKELLRTKQSLARKIRNIKIDYSGVSQEDMPEDVLQEIAGLMAELNDTREGYAAKSNR